MHDEGFDMGLREAIIIHDQYNRVDLLHFQNRPNDDQRVTKWAER